MLIRRRLLIDRAARFAARTVCTALWLSAILGVVLVVLGVLFAQLAQAAPVRWTNPGADRYTGTTKAALRRYEGIIPAADLAMIRRAVLAPASARRWTDLATLAPDGITGRQQYAPVLEHMMFGRDRMAQAVDLGSLPPGTRLGARVYCAAGPLCLAIVSECGNPVVLRRLPPAPARTVPNEPGDTDGGGGGGLRFLIPPPLWLVPTVPREVQSAPVPPPPTLIVQDDAPPPVIPIERGAVPFIALPEPMPGETVVIFVPTPPVSEPSTVALLLAGIGLIAYKARRRG